MSIGQPGRRVLAGAVGLLITAGLGGVALASAENTTYLDGLSLAFSTVSTTGFGPGPQTGLGLAATMTIFFCGASCWFLILVAAFEAGLRRHMTAISPGDIHRPVHDPWQPIQLTQRKRGRG